MPKPEPCGTRSIRSCRVSVREAPDCRVRCQLTAAMKAFTGATPQLGRTCQAVDSATHEVRDCGVVSDVRLDEAGQLAGVGMHITSCSR